MADTARAGAPRVSDLRILRVISVSQWAALVLGILAGIIINEGSLQSFVAAAAGGLFVLTVSAVPLQVMRRPLVLESMALGGSLLTMTAVALTGGASSPYILLSTIPPVTASILGGLRIGVTTGTLSAAVLVAISLGTDDGNVAQAVGLAMLYLLLVVTVGQIRRLLIDIEERASKLEETSEEAQQRLDELSATNELLTRLAELASENTGPIAVGRTALDTITAMIPDAAGTAVLTTASGPLVIAQHGNGRDHPIRTRLPLEVNGREVGVILLSTKEILTEGERKRVEAAIEPVALSFANLLLLQQIAGTAVQEERSRLARELHDEIGPTLASLGLALDMAAMQTGEPDVASHLTDLRSSVSHLVDDVRATVADLRAERSGSLSTRLNAALHQFPSHPPIEMAVDERRPPRPSIIDEIAAIVIEAARNASRHADAHSIRIHGWVDFDRGRLVVQDTGSGFDTQADHPGHFGLVGMGERAKRIGARVVVTSSSAGTVVALEWGDS